MTNIKYIGILLHSDFLNKIVQNSAPPILNKIVQNSIRDRDRDRDRDRSDKSRDWDVHFGSLLFKDLSYLRPCLKLNLPRRRFAAPAAPCAQSECIARFARTFSIGTPRATSLRGCFEGLLRTLNTHLVQSWTSPVRVHRSLR